MENSLRSKTFFLALKEFHDSPHKARKYFKDRRITLLEKKILDCWYLLRDGKSETIIQQLEEMPDQHDPLVDSQKKLILGIAYNNCGKFLQGLPKIEEAALILDQHKLDYYSHIAHSNRFNVYYNLKNKDGMKRALRDIRKIKKINARQEILFLIFKMNYYSFNGKTLFAERLLPLIESKIKTMNESLLINFYTSRFSHEIRCKDFKRADRTLKEMKKFRKFHFNSNFKFMRLLLDHLQMGKPIYVYQHDFDTSPMLHHQIQVIKQLEESNVKEATAHWNQLIQIQPGVYGAPFQYLGDPCLFSICLDQYSRVTQQDSTIAIPADSTKEQALFSILNKATQPIKKEELYRLIWNKNNPDKDDLNRLKVLISRARAALKVEIVYKKGCYQLNSLK